MAMPVEIYYKIRKLANDSESAPMEYLRDILKLDAETFNKNLSKWATEFGLNVNGEYIDFTGCDITGLITDLETLYPKWKAAGNLTPSTKSPQGSPEFCMHCGALVVDPNAIFCLDCGKRLHVTGDE